MNTYLSLLGSALRATLSSRQHLVLENLALRQQLAVLSRQSRRPRLAPSDRLFWSFLSQLWSRWQSAVVFVEPETVPPPRASPAASRSNRCSASAGRATSRVRVAGCVTHPDTDVILAPHRLCRGAVLSHTRANSTQYLWVKRPGTGNYSSAGALSW